MSASEPLPKVPTRPLPPTGKPTRYRWVEIGTPRVVVAALDLSPEPEAETAETE